MLYVFSAVTQLYTMYLEIVEYLYIISVFTLENSLWTLAAISLAA